MIYISNDHTCELVELLGLSYVELQLNKKDNFIKTNDEYYTEAVIIDLPSNYKLCLRCRKKVNKVVDINDEFTQVCHRCSDAIKICLEK